MTAHSTSTAKAVGVYRVTKPWTTSATWDTYDGTHSWTTPGGDFSNPETESDAAVNPSVGASSGWYYWYPTKLVQEWVNTTKAPEYEGKATGYANEGLIVKDQTDNQTANMLTIDSPSASSDQPYLEIAYEPRGVGSEPQYTMVATPLTDKSTLGVNVANGNILLQSSQLQMTGVAGFGYSDTRVWNGLNGEKQEYGHWEDSNALELEEYGDGSVSFEDGTGAWFEFQKQSTGSFMSPPGIKAVMCAAGSPSPCPSSLPTGVGHELIYDASEEKVEFTNEGKLIQEDRYGHKVASEFIAAHTIAYTDPQGHKIERVDEGSEHYVSELKDLSGERKLTFTYKNFGEGEPELESATEADGKTTSYEYSNYTVTKITDPDGHVTKLGYDSHRRITEITRVTNLEHGTGPTTKLAYYETGKAPGEYCAANQTGTLVRDPDWTKPAGEKEGKEFKLAAHETLYCANVLDQVEKTFDAAGNETAATFDPFGNQLSATAAPRETGASRGVTSLVYGVAGKNLGCVVEGTTGKPRGECPSGALEQGYATSSKYEDKTFANQPTTETSTRQKSANLCYWEGGHPCTGTELEGATGTAGGLKRETDALTSENSTNFSYNTEGTLKGTIKATTDAGGHKTTYEYDEKGNLKTIVPPAGSGLGKTTITVDPDGRPHTITQCLVESGGSCTSSETTTLSYDKDDRVTEAVDTGPGATKTFKYTYDGDGNLEKREDPTGTTKFTYDALRRVIKEELPGSATEEYTYDAASNLAAFTDSGGMSEYKYNGLNELEAMAEPSGNCGETPSKCTRVAYDNDGSLTKLTYPSGATLNYTLEPATGRPTKIAAKNPAGTTLLSNEYTYKEGTNDTPLINHDFFTGPGGVTAATTYDYDALERLTFAETQSEPEAYAPSCYQYGYDGAGNRTSEAYTNKPNTCTTSGPFYRYNTGNELECRMKTEGACSKSSSSEISGYSYDGAGNETTITGYNDPASTTFSYNNLNQLKAITPPSSSERAVTYLGSGQSILTGFGSNTLQNSSLGLTKQVNESGTSYYARTSAVCSWTSATRRLDVQPRI